MNEVDEVIEAAVRKDLLQLESVLAAADAESEQLAALAAAEQRKLQEIVDLA